VCPIKGHRHRPAVLAPPPPPRATYGRMVEPSYAEKVANPAFQFAPEPFSDRRQTDAYRKDFDEAITVKLWLRVS
jgi:hypothetical protein